MTRPYTPSNEFLDQFCLNCRNLRDGRTDGRPGCPLLARSSLPDRMLPFMRGLLVCDDDGKNPRCGAFCACTDPDDCAEDAGR